MGEFCRTWRAAVASAGGLGYHKVVGGPDGRVGTRGEPRAGETAMRRMMLSALVMSAIGVGAIAPVRAGETSFKKEIEELNLLTGLDPVEGMLRQLMKGKEKTASLIEAALPL